MEEGAFVFPSYRLKVHGKGHFNLGFILTLKTFLFTIQVIIYIYIHGNVTMKLCISYLVQTKMSFSKMENRNVKQVLSGRLVPVGRGEYKERG
jgi:hypothetical protein